MRVLLDTNAYTALFRGHKGVAGTVRRAEQVLISTIVAGELLFGFRNGSRFETNKAELDDFLSSDYVALLPVTVVTADRFGRIAAALRRKGKPLPTNDIWIAAHAMESGADLL
ncbi:MAG: tRNA(fMet)-specific endonuclease VapC, partial [Acidobacteriota bacterium]|nr:tRNA(fMet)-specific endonuclease VapC [Acidobacteriota bacterium]